VDIVEYYDRNWNHRPYADDLNDILVRLLSETGRQGEETTLIIDGLDLCCSHQDLLSALSDLSTSTSTSTSICRLLVTSRVEEEIEYAFETHPRLALQPRLVRDEVAAFVKSEVERRPALKRLDASLKQEVVAAVSRGNYGWGWAVQSLETVAHMRTDGDVKRAIKDIRSRKGYRDDMGNGEGNEPLGEIPAIA